MGSKKYGKEMNKVIHYRATFTSGNHDYAYAKEIYAAARAILLRPENKNKNILEMHKNEGSYDNPQWSRMMFSSNKIFQSHGGRILI